MNDIENCNEEVYISSYFGVTILHTFGYLFFVCWIYMASFKADIIDKPYRPLVGATIIPFLTNSKGELITFLVIMIIMPVWFYYAYCKWDVIQIDINGITIHKPDAINNFIAWDEISSICVAENKSRMHIVPLIIKRRPVVQSDSNDALYLIFAALDSEKAVRTLSHYTKKYSIDFTQN